MGQNLPHTASKRGDSRPNGINYKHLNSSTHAQDLRLLRVPSLMLVKQLAPWRMACARALCYVLQGKSCHDLSPFSRSLRFEGPNRLSRAVNETWNLVSSA